MNRSPRATELSAVLAALAIALAAGCGRADAERRDAGDRYLRRALAARQAEDVDGAIRWCEKALRRRPDLAAAHRELALMQDHFKQDRLAALYHYRRYLELRPDSAERADVEEMMATCGRALAAQLLAEGTVLPPPPAAAVPAVAPRVAAPAAVAPAAATEPQTHVVQAGENLATISSRYYGTPSKWKLIFSANQDRLNDANNLRVGTRIAIPPS